MRQYKVTSFYDGEVVTTGWLKSKSLAKFSFWLISLFPWFVTRWDEKEE